MNEMRKKKREEQDEEQAVSVNITDVYESMAASLSLKTIVLQNKNTHKMSLKKN